MAAVHILFIFVSKPRLNFVIILLGQSSCQSNSCKCFGVRSANIFFGVLSTNTNTHINLEPELIPVP